MEPSALTLPTTYRFPAAVEYFETHSNGAVRCRLHHASGCVDAWIWANRDPFEPRLLRSGTATTLALTNDEDTHVVVNFEEDRLPVLADILDPRLCQVHGVVKQAAEMIDQLQSMPLRRLMVSALLDPDAFEGYWTSPASRRHHHAYRGGLARHSLEVATMVSSIARLSSEECEVGVVAALLHDYGKIWCYGVAGVTDDGRRHEAIGLAKLSEPLSILQGEDPQVAAMLIEILGGPRANPDQTHPLALGRIVRALDQHSCEADRREAESISAFSR